MQFPKSYAQMALLGVSFSELIEMTILPGKTILLRGLSLCHMDLYEYIATEKPLKSRDSFLTIDEKMKGINLHLKGDNYQCSLTLHVLTYRLSSSRCVPMKITA